MLMRLPKVLWLFRIWHQFFQSSFHFQKSFFGLQFIFWLDQKLVYFIYVSFHIQSLKKVCQLEAKLQNRK